MTEAMRGGSVNLRQLSVGDVSIMDHFPKIRMDRGVEAVQAYLKNLKD